MTMARKLLAAAPAAAASSFEFWDPSSAGGSWTWTYAYDAAGPNMSGTYSDTDAVSGPWLDEIGSNDVTRAGGGTLTYTAAASGLNNRAAIDFDGTGYFQNYFGSTVTQPHSVVSVFLSDAASAGERIVSGASLTTQRHIQWIDGSPAKWALYAGSTIYSTTNVNTSGHVLVTVANGASGKVRLDGTTETTANAGTQTWRPVTIGANYNGSSGYFNGRIAAIGLFNGDILAQSGFSTWETALKTHYGI